MPTLTTKLGIPKPNGNEVVSRAGFWLIYDQIDLATASQDQVDRPFYLKTLVYDAPNDRLALTFGPGRVLFGVSTLVNATVDQTIYVTTPAINTTYTVHLNEDGTFTVDTTGAFYANRFMLWQAVTGPAVATLSKIDKRPDEALRTTHAATHAYGGTDPIAVSDFVRVGTLGARPAAGAVAVGTIYLATDDAGGRFARSNGATWVVAGAGTSSPPAAHAASHATGGTDLLSHDVLPGVSADDHHPQSHAHNGADSSGTVAYGSLTGTPGTFAPSAHAASHAPAGGDSLAASYVQIGAANTTVVRQIAMIHQIDTKYTTYTYDAQGRLQTETIYASNGGALILTITYAYNADGSINTVTEVLPGAAPNTVVTTYGYTSGLPTSESRAYS